MKRSEFEAMLEDMPAGTERALLRILSYHIGRHNAISRQSLVIDLGNHGIEVHERVVRAAINQLRKNGTLICSTGGTGGGYYMAGDWGELEEFLEREMHARAMDLLEQERALRVAGERVWGPQLQMELKL